jgi:hypothetical protein
MAFLAFTGTNVLLFIDLAVLPHQIDLALVRNALTLVGVLVLLHALIHDNT